MMKIGLVGSLDFGEHSGARTRATRIYSLLADDHEVTFLNVNTVNQSPIPEGIAGRDVALRPGWAPHTLRELTAGYRAVVAAQHYEFDLVWAYNSFQHTPLIGYAMARRLNRPLIVGVNDHRHGRGFKGQVINEHGRRFVLTNADVLVFESETLQRNLDEYGITARQSVVAPTGIDIEQYHHPRRQLAEDPVVFYVGRDKDIDLLLDAAQCARERLPTLTVRLAGVDAAAYPEYADVPYIEFLGFVSEAELQAEMARAHVCTVPYRDADTAGRPVKILEYMSAEKCIVATDLPFNTQMLTNDENAIITAPTPDAFADGLVAVLSDPERRERLATQARADVRAYSLERMHESLTEAITLATD
jgi:glycosyltransferase involved in cell wall biosynthesis